MSPRLSAVSVSFRSDYMAHNPQIPDQTWQNPAGLLSSRWTAAASSRRVISRNLAAGWHRSFAVNATRWLIA